MTSFAAWMTPAEFKTWRKLLREDYARIRQYARTAHTAIGYGLCDSDDIAPPLPAEDAR